MEEYIEHHGVKGQRWGVRKKRPTGSGRKAHSKKNNTSEKFKNGERFLKQVSPVVASVAVRTIVVATPAAALAPIFSVAAATSVRMLTELMSEKDVKHG